MSRNLPTTSSPSVASATVTWSICRLTAFTTIAAARAIATSPRDSASRTLAVNCDPMYSGAAIPFDVVGEQMTRFGVVLSAIIAWSAVAHAETPEQWIALGTRVHGGFGSFIPLGIRIGLDAMQQLKAKPRELEVLYYDSDESPCACFADG